MTDVRTLPIRVAPVGGEALDSWLATIAHRTQTGWPDLLTALEPAATYPADRRNSRGNWTVYLHPDEADSIAAATGIDVAVVEATTLAQFDGTALAINRERRTVARGFPWGRGRGSRFCPECLAESDGRWQLVWRLGWVFSCPKHRCLLADTCPTCGRRQRLKPYAGSDIPHPGRCTMPADAATGRSAPRCTGELASARVTQLPANHPTLRAQRLVLDVIATDTGSFGVYADQAQSARGILSDIRAVARRILDYASVDDLAARLPGDLVDAFAQVRPQPSGPQSTTGPTRKPGLASPAHAAIAAVGVTLAVEILDSPDIPAAGESLQWLLHHGRNRGLAVNATTTTSWGTGTTATLAAVQLSSLTPFLQASDLLRYRTAAAVPIYPAPDASTAIPAQRVPTMLWPEWALRFVLPSCRYPMMRQALAAAVMLVGSRLNQTEAGARIGSTLSPIAVTRYLSFLRTDRHWEDSLRALTRLADYLSTHAVPIDYDRRRCLDYKARLLPDELWAQICRQTATVPGGGRKADLVRTMLFERISGLPAEQSPFAKYDYGFQRSFATLPRELTPDLAAQFDRAARQFLDEHGLIDEPVQWHPPLHLLAGLNLPGTDPSAVDVGELHLHLRRDKETLSTVAARLGTSIDTVRHLLEVHPAPEALTSAQQRTRGAAIATATAALPESRLLDLYYLHNQSLHDIATTVGVSKQTIAQLARSYGVPLRHTGRSAHVAVDRDWFYDQYVNHRRTLTDIGREVGLGPAAISRRAKEHGIPIRPPGGPSH